MKVSIIVPAYNEEKVISLCLNALIDQNYPKKNYEILAVNDGSTDETLKILKEKQKEVKKKGFEIKIINLKKNQGRVIARETGAKEARYERLLFLDAKCIPANNNLLKNIKEIAYQPIIGNPIIDPEMSFFDRFNWLIRKKLYAPYYGENFKPVYIDKNNFDRITKGTGVFICDKKLFLSSQPENKTETYDVRLLWNIARRKKMLRHPDLKAVYFSRTSLKEEMKHLFERGPKFIDYYLSPKKKYFWLFIFLPLASLIFTIIIVFMELNLLFYWLAFLCLILSLVSAWFAENAKDFLAIIAILPIIGFSFELGILKGLFLKLFKK